MPPKQQAPVNRDAFRRFARRSLGITEAVQARFERAGKAVSLGTPPKMAPVENPVYIFGPVLSDEFAAWYREGWDATGAYSANDLLTFTSPGTIRQQLEGIAPGADFTLLINSDGGDVAAATAGGAMIDDRIEGGSQVLAKIVGDALSAASTLMLRSTDSEIDPMGLVMIHSPWTITAGNPRELRKDADTLEKIEAGVADFYAQRTPLSDEEAMSVMEAETWYSAQEVVDAGIIRRVSAAPMAAEDGDKRPEDEMAAEAVADLTVLCAGLDARRSAIYDPAGLLADKEVA